MDFDIYVEWEPAQQRAIHYTLYNSLKDCRSRDFISEKTYNVLTELIRSATSQTCEEILEDYYSILEKYNLISHLYQQLLYHKYIDPLYNIDFLYEDTSFQKYLDKKIITIIESL
jgi:hypothetical protein